MLELLSFLSHRLAAPRPGKDIHERIIEDQTQQSGVEKSKAAASARGLVREGHDHCLQMPSMQKEWFTQVQSVTLACTSCSGPQEHQYLPRNLARMHILTHLDSKSCAFLGLLYRQGLILSCPHVIVLLLSRCCGCPSLQLTYLQTSTHIFIARSVYLCSPAIPVQLS